MFDSGEDPGPLIGFSKEVSQVTTTKRVRQCMEAWRTPRTSFVVARATHRPLHQVWVALREMLANGEVTFNQEDGYLHVRFGEET